MLPLLRHTQVRACTRVWPALILTILAAACDSIPERHGATTLPPGSQAAVTRQAQVPAETVLADEAFFNLAPIAHAGAASSATAAPGGGSIPVGISSLPPGAPAASDASTLTEAMLIDELARRWDNKWKESRNSGADRSWNTMRDGLAIGLLRPDHGSEALLSAVAALASSKAAPGDLRLLAAAYHLHHGDGDAAQVAISGLFDEAVGEGDARASVAATSAAPFEVAALSFARSIEGPGKFTAASADEIAPGRKLLIYGEFRNFKNEPEDAAADGSFRRSFTASLRLVDARGTELDRLEFLPRKRGLQRSQAESSVTNFWAKYQLPGDIAPGAYRIIVAAEDLLGSSNAIGELSFDIQPGATAGGATGR